MGEIRPASETYRLFGAEAPSIQAGVNLPRLSLVSNRMFERRERASPESVAMQGSCARKLFFSELAMRDFRRCHW